MRRIPALLALVSLTVATVSGLPAQASSPARSVIAKASSAANLISSGGFETGTAAAASGWSRSQFATGATFSRNRKQAHSGQASAEINAPKANDVRWVQTVTVHPNTVYRLSGWIKTQDVATSGGGDVGANLGFDGTWTHSPGLLGSHGWTRVAITISSGSSTSLTVAARLGYWRAASSGTAWYDDVRLEEVKTQNRAPGWKILVLLYGATDFAYTDATGPHRVVGSTRSTQLSAAAAAATAFVTRDIPVLDNGYMTPSVTVRRPSHPLKKLDRQGDGWWPSPADTAADRSPGFDAVIVIWNPNGIDQTSKQQRYVGSTAAVTPNMGVRQGYTTLIMDAATNYGHRNVFKQQFGQLILSFFAAAGTAPQPKVNTQAEATTYVNCYSGHPYVWVDETLAQPVAHSIYNDDSGFTHDYYSGKVARAGSPKQCLGISHLSWRYGGPLALSGADT
jgi:hypothetical protein